MAGKAKSKGQRGKICAVPMPSSSTASVSVRQISNGFIVTKSEYSDKSGYKETQTYTPNKPDLNIVPEKGRGKK